MGVLSSAIRIRHDLHTRLTEARKRTDELFAIVREEALYDRPIAERHRIIFYVGHVESFDWNLLAQRAFGLQSFHESFDKLFAFGIDPVGGGLPTDTPADWPSHCSPGLPGAPATSSHRPSSPTSNGSTTPAAATPPSATSAPPTTNTATGLAA